MCMLYKPGKTDAFIRVCARVGGRGPTNGPWQGVHVATPDLAAFYGCLSFLEADTGIVSKYRYAQADQLVEARKEAQNDLTA